MKVFVKPIEEDQYIHPIAFGEYFKLILGKEDIDLRGDNSKWRTQFSNIFGSIKKQNVSCFKASKVVLKNYGVDGGNLGVYSKNENQYGFLEPNNVIQTAVESNKKIIILQDGAKKAVRYLDQELEKGFPVLVGVRHTYFEKDTSKKGYQYSHDEYNYDKSTDHFIVIVGRGYKDGQRFFRFYEVGTKYKEKGVHNENKLILNEDWSLTGSPQHNTRVYTLTHVRGNKTNGDFN